MADYQIEAIRKQLRMLYSDDSLRTAQRAMIDRVITKEEYKVYESAYHESLYINLH